MFTYRRISIIEYCFCYNLRNFTLYKTGSFRRARKVARHINFCGAVKISLVETRTQLKLDILDGRLLTNTYTAYVLTYFREIRQILIQ